MKLIDRVALTVIAASASWPVPDADRLSRWPNVLAV